MNAGRILGVLILAGVAMSLTRRAQASQSPGGAQPFSITTYLPSFDTIDAAINTGYDYLFEEPPAVAADGAIALDAVKQEAGLLDQIGAALQPTSYGFDAMQNPNVQAFLAMIRYAEGADYQTLFGGSKFQSFADHPRTVITAGKYKSSAAGAYQILARTWDDVRGRIGATDFSPYWQDQAAIFLIKRRGALPDVLAGRFEDAINKVRKEWASLPGAGYGQPERSLANLRNVYAANGGTFGTVV